MNIGRTRFIGGVVPHASSGTFAAATAAFTSSALDSGKSRNLLAGRRIEDRLRARGVNGSPAAVDGVLDHVHWRVLTSGLFLRHPRPSARNAALATLRMTFRLVSSLSSAPS